MARYSYDVDTLQRLIDVHKQFQGGLKTVDTDDSLKDIYLREAENVSLSEFNFVEKRYGTHKLAEHKPWTSLESNSSPLQGYFEYYVDANTVHKIVAIEGQFYIDQGAGFNRVEFFTRPANTPFLDLSSLGIYTEDMVNTIATGSPFGTQLPRFCESTTDLLELVGEFNGEKIYVFSNDKYYTWNSTTELWGNDVTETDTYPAEGFVQGEYYYDTRTMSTYKWTASTGKIGTMNANESFYKADFQKTRSIEGIRLDDKLYIATGTYPVYYKGDGKIYVFPRYMMSDLDVREIGYNLNSLSIENDLYEEKEIAETSSHGQTYDGDTLTLKNTLEYGNSIVIKEGVISPLIPFVKPSSINEITFKVAYHLYNNSAKNFYAGFDSSVVPSGYTTAYGKLQEIGSTGTYYPIILRNEYFVRASIERRLSGGTDQLYEEVENSPIYEITNDVAKTGFNRMPLSSSDILSNIELKFKNDVSGFYDYRVKIGLYKRGYKGRLVEWYGVSDAEGLARWTNQVGVYQVNIAGTYATLNDFVTYLNTERNGYGSSLTTTTRGGLTGDDALVARVSDGAGGYHYAFYRTIVDDFVNGDSRNYYQAITNTTSEDNITEELLSESSIQFLDVWTTPEKLEDYKDEPINSLKVHTCNRITEHNNRLALYGNPSYPDYVFFSTAGAKEYFPYGYALQFTNELREGVNAITKFMNILVVQSDSYTWGVKGDSPQPLSALEGSIYQKIMINPTIGCIAPYSVKNVRNQLYFLSKEGIFTLRALYAEDNRYNVDPIDRNIYNIVPRDTKSVAAYFDDQYWLNFPSTGETLRYYVDKKAWVKDTYDAWNTFGGVFKYINQSGKLRFITNLSQLEVGDPLKVFDIEVDYSLPTDLTKNIVSKFTTSYLNQNYPFHIKNYKEAKFDFAIQNEYNTSMENLPIANYAETVNYVQFTVDLIDRHFYSITFEPDEIGARPAAYTVEIDSVQVLAGNITQTGDNLSTIRFMSNKTGNVTVKITVTGKIVTANLSADDIKLYDSTYDHTVTFNTLVLSEEGTLNIDPIDSYTEADVEVPIDLGTRTGNWTFGTSNFGNVIVAVKTVKLAGRGYNSKVSVIEDSKSKWTLESLGITYKMKKARSR